MTWFWVFLVIALAVGLLAWAARRQRRHAGSGTMDEAKRDALRREPGHGGGYDG